MVASFGETLLVHLKDKRIEVYTGSSAREREYADFTIAHKDVIRGVLRDASGDLMVIEVVNNAGHSNLIYVNCWTVTAVVEPKNGMSIVDMYCDEHKKQVK
ncbi:MAG TPA: hypothetical protein VI423_00630 [Paenisporosarcina sp.]|nr:hypothetical protein [Paenisporosarcina sp.]